MSLQAERRYSPEEYLALERRAELKSEYFAGRIYAMAGASPAHNLIVTNVVRELSSQLRQRPCRVYSNDQRVRIDATGLYTYPDIVVTCNAERFDERDQDTLLNPLLIVEVLSRTTESYDRGDKAEHYRKLASLAEYLLIARNKAHVEHYARQPDGHWLLQEAAGPGAVIEMPAIDCRLALAEIYDKVTLHAAGPGHPPAAG